VGRECFGFVAASRFECDVAVPELAIAKQLPRSFKRRSRRSSRRAIIAAMAVPQPSARCSTAWRWGGEMAEQQSEIRFGIGTMLAEGKPATAVVVEDRVAPLTDLVAR
jgi:hypothetical protein